MSTHPANVYIEGEKCNVINGTGIDTPKGHVSNISFNIGANTSVKCIQNIEHRERFIYH